jgi:hypothetical protein
MRISTYLWKIQHHAFLGRAILQSTTRRYYSNFKKNPSLFVNVSVRLEEILMQTLYAANYVSSQQIFGSRARLRMSAVIPNEQRRRGENSCLLASKQEEGSRPIIIHFAI